MIIFAFNDNTVRHAMLSGEPWFHATDLCRCLGLDLTDGTRRHLAKLAPTESRLLTRSEHPELFSGSFAPTAKYVSEPGLYKLIARSNQPEAKAFDRWVRHEVLPAIRKTGGYLLNEDMRETVLAVA